MRLMIKIFFVMMAALLAACDIGGSVDERVAAARARNDGPAIWVVKDHDSTLYLYGTVHLIPSDMPWQREDMKEAFDKAGTVFFELDTNTETKFETNLLVQQHGFLPSGKRLSDGLDNYQHKLLTAAALNGGVPYEMLNSMKPWLASEFLTVAAAEMAGLSSDVSPDEALKSRAARLGKNIIFLDSIEEQIMTSANQPEFVQMILLSETLERFNSVGNDLRDIAQAWSVGQTDFLTAKTVIALSARSPELYSTLIKDRNRKWVNVLDRFMEGNDTGFAAVGVAHLLGEDSLQNALEAKGYKVSRYYAFKGENVIKTVYEQ